ncbi:MAG: methionine--tRNA ligase subunit beta [Candidatus Yanofskybacteria bacterium RIFCSPLOWO2_01_FULL_41_34]|uniref:Methionine--tRNA ligase n=1 Tax=Candidatus Yanofskybacteria bacterium RIFCSPHIGHO2_01_FULL_41_26 TaxID=1802661 RepID=A0A1F8EG21_9BACT|nr:MAG: methionine--tRNA ligase subunit beta [Candidatus Yanofskybacteria bacterium RIFCSPHIGHO2_01_FULL_41_26]OGN21093.1 MAG: methionine--tRNA ligase subunit beta [Candidatus Yanofskybacteria bacterium RIFCSPLOWO2_01_FULL_41_34]
MITIDEFKKVELKVAKVVSAESVDGSEKLLRLILDLGPEEKANLPAGRQVIAGIGKAYNPEDLIGKQIVIVANLEPRSLMGLESQGMVLAANSKTGPILIIPEKEVALGTELR